MKKGTLENVKQHASLIGLPLCTYILIIMGFSLWMKKKLMKGNSLAGNYAHQLTLGVGDLPLW